MDSTAELKSLLAQLAEHLDSAEGPGGGAICLDAIAELERLTRPAPEPGSG
ncbi:MAG: hypothetical protein KDA20_13465 [Phycisphaerales bacterium]|nr:hypothetical protein [Phycisphaerales bacterium]